MECKEFEFEKFEICKNITGIELKFTQNGKQQVWRITCDGSPQKLITTFKQNIPTGLTRGKTFLRPKNENA